MIKTVLIHLIFISLLASKSYAQVPKSSYGPVFDDMGATYDLKGLDFVPDSNAVLKAIFDIDYMPKDSTASNALISSLHRYLNMHVKNGVKESNISLAFVLHGASTKDALTDKAYFERYGMKNPNTHLIQTLAAHNVEMFICGQSASYSGITKAEMLPEIKMALSAMTVLTIYQANGYSLIKF